jgi:hypothetical protein
MDIKSGEFTFDIHTGRPTSHVQRTGFLDPEIAGEGFAADPDVAFSAPEPIIPDFSKIKTIRKYFKRPPGAGGYFPTWLYHPTHPPRIFTRSEAAEVGVFRRKANAHEKGSTGADFVWDWDEENDQGWRPFILDSMVHDPRKFDPNKPGTGKEYVAKPPNPIIAQNALLADLIPTVTAAVVTALKHSSSAVAPGHVDPAEWEEFLRFQAFKKTTQAVETLAQPALHASGEASTKAPDPERIEWEEAANRVGLKVDRRWNLDRLKTEVEKKAAANEAAMFEQPAPIETSEAP